MGICFSTLAEVGPATKDSDGSSNTRPSSRGHMTPFSGGTPPTGSTFGTFSGESVDDMLPQGEDLPLPTLRIFTFAELKTATKNFKPDTLLGEGGFGRVYKAWVDEGSLNPTKSGIGIMVAVKKLNPESMQGIEEWKSEVNFLGKLSHPNLVKLLGYCLEDTELLLVYEFMPRGCLEHHLFKRASVQPLPWDVRLKILIGAARGLVFLHKDKGKIIYRDFKSANILLDSNFDAKISDFGLAKLGPTGPDTHVSTRIMGTRGYVAPEYVATGHLYVKSDVYGFGVVLLETLSGRRALDRNRPSGEVNLVDWAKPLLCDRRKITRFMDMSLERKYPAKAAFKAGQLALRCVAQNPKMRPSMEEVLNDLQRIGALKGKSKNSELSTERSTIRSRKNKPSQPTVPAQARQGVKVIHFQSKPEMMMSDSQNW